MLYCHESHNFATVVKSLGCIVTGAYELPVNQDSRLPLTNSNAPDFKQLTVWEVMEDGGPDLFKYIHRHDRLPPDVQPLRLTEKRWVLYCIAHALEGLHALGLVYRDLKPNNVVRDANGKVLLIELGMVRAVDRMGRHGVTGEATDVPTDCENVANGQYKSPELWRGEEDAQGPWIDSWALGCVVYELYTGNPFLGNGTETALADRLRGGGNKPQMLRAELRKAHPELDRVDNPSKASTPTALSLLADLLAGLMHEDPKERWTASQMLDHPFVKDLKHTLPKFVPNLNRRPSREVFFFDRLDPEKKVSLPEKTSKDYKRLLHQHPLWVLFDALNWSIEGVKPKTTPRR
uniref:Protein kinase domain-containing protein n=1 Tax=Chromera velia CCMP2878 TaxID=1169474 RepID=A0A0G4IFL5_9ALVE|eukprot:Cvel_2487.t1-p1 / transcript=Cvel_2487.t1 / gene=Cvel_2487 / organism=Chromera_velia_CCMP2878 / gene_product=Cyclin-dependent kinase-like 3, putative / transcript_product=Cyclin-dependent kinase-like 3, putative / location=Cvel_scaffold97:137479-139798(-) / protein_length=347 / sequence_SO=supercontig / SO=protein_coding / is_pseudo=false